MQDLQTEFLRGQQLRREGRLQDALAVFDALVRRFPKSAAPLERRGMVLCALDRFDEGLVDVRAAIGMDPRNAEFRNDLGLMLYILGRKPEARSEVQRALVLEPGYKEALINWCLVLKEEGDFEGVERTARRLLLAHPGLPQANNHLSNALLCLGRFSEAWGPYCERPRPDVSVRDAGVPAVVAHADELPTAPSPIVVHGEQGLGDVIFFLRFAPRLKALGHRLAFWGDAKLQGILAASGLFEHFIARESVPAAGLTVVWAGDLPKLLGASDPAAFPPPLRLALDPGRKEAFREQLARLGPPPYIGLTWRAGLQSRRLVLSKAIDPEALGAALAGVRATFISLQRAPLPGETERLAAKLGAAVHDASAVNERLEDAFGLIALLDDYAGVSNTNTHLRASAGRGAHVLIPWPPEWRWLRDVERSPWYPAMTLYRQARDGDWRGALERLASDLRLAP